MRGSRPPLPIDLSRGRARQRCYGAVQSHSHPLGSSAEGSDSSCRRQNSQIAPSLARFLVELHAWHWFALSALKSTIKCQGPCCFSYRLYHSIYIQSHGSNLASYHSFKYMFRLLIWHHYYWKLRWRKRRPWLSLYLAIFHLIFFFCRR